MEVKGKKITVLGGGRSGLAAARLLNRQGAAVFLSESRREEDVAEAAGRLEQAQIAFETGGHTHAVYEADLMVVSPGIAVDSDILKQAKRMGIPVYSELEIAGWFCKSPIIAVTGSNGKTTTTSLIGRIFQDAGIPTVVAGNIGTAFSDFADQVPPEGMVVLEVSSFQLETIHEFHPNVAVFLNLTPDHLDRHETMETYGRMKARIFENQEASDILVYNGLDIRVSRLAKQARGRRAVFGIETAGNACAYMENWQLVLKNREDRIVLMPADEMQIRGEHNMANAMAAALSAWMMDVPVDVIRKGLAEFQALPHRLEPVRTVKEVLWVNDSKATNVDAVWYALGSFTRPVILIAGGRDKNSDFSFLRERIKSHVREIILIGESAEKMKKSFTGIVPLSLAADLDEAVAMAANRAQAGDVVLLSPACASFDMFEDYMDRGEKFKKLVHQL